MPQYEVTVKKVVEATHVVAAETQEDAEYKATCEASDSNTVEILSTSAREMTDGLLSS